MSKGHVFLAQNSDVDYVRQACALALSIKKFNKTHNATCIITNDDIPPAYAHAFDHIVTIPWADSAVDSSWKIENRWKIIHASPFKENLVYDTDMLLLNSNDHWWEHFSNHELLFTSKVNDFRGNVVASDYYRKTFTANQLPNLYVGCFYFRKTKTSYNFFKWLAVLTNNWQDFYRDFLTKTPQKFCSIDVNAALAIKFMDLENRALISNGDIPRFTHMKPGIQDFKTVPTKWTDVLPVCFDEDCNLKVGNIKQTGLFHYVEDEFLTDKMLQYLVKDSQ
jgi:hypothetical protein